MHFFKHLGQALAKVSDKGFGIIHVMIVMIIICTIALSFGNLMSNMGNTQAMTKAAIGRDSLVAAMMSILSEQGACNSSLNPNTPFDPVTAALPALQASQPGTHLPLNFSFQSSFYGAGQTIGSLTPGFNPLFNLNITNIYFAAATTSAPPYNIELAAGPLHGLTVYKGQVWVSSSWSEHNGGNIPIDLEDHLIASNVYVWVGGGVIQSCGIMKTPEQFCVDDLGGVFTAGATPPCANPHYPCHNGFYFLGYDATGVAQCSPSPTTCLANQTITSAGGGNTACTTVP